jgi:hypothetical protein
MKSFLPLLVFVFVLSGCYFRSVEGADSPLAQYVGRQAEVRKRIVVYDRGMWGRLGVPAGEWSIAPKEKVTIALEPGARFEVIGVASRRIESGKHYYLACRYRAAQADVTFDYPADDKFIGADFLSWR